MRVYGIKESDIPLIRPVLVHQNYANNFKKAPSWGPVVYPLTPPPPPPQPLHPQQPQQPAKASKYGQPFTPTPKTSFSLFPKNMIGPQLPHT